MRGFLESTTVRIVLALWAFNLAKALLPMLQAHSLDLWKLAEVSVEFVIALFLRSSMSDMKFPLNVPFLDKVLASKQGNDEGK